MKLHFVLPKYTLTTLTRHITFASIWRVCSIHIFNLFHGIVVLD